MCNRFLFRDVFGEGSTAFEGGIEQVLEVGRDGALLSVKTETLGGHPCAEILTMWR